MSTSALTDAIYQMTPGNSQGQPVVITYDQGAMYEASAPPSDYSAMTAWAVVYQEAGASVAPNNASDTVTVANYTTYLHLTNGTWVKVQDQNQSGVGGDNYAADFAGNYSRSFSVFTHNGDGSYTFNTPPAADSNSTSGYNDHFWPYPMATYTPGTVDGVFTVAQMKTNDPAENLIVQFGADWWRNTTSPNGNFTGNQSEVGGNDWVKLTTNYQTLYFTTFSASELQANPPPGL